MSYCGPEDPCDAGKGMYQPQPTRRPLASRCGRARLYKTDTDSEGQLVEVNLTCDRRAGHNGSHRARYDGGKVFWK
jgi:hypothetical protein